MKEIKIYVDSANRPTKKCPYNEGVCGNAKVGGKYCLNQCPGRAGVHPSEEIVYCIKESV